MTNSKQTFTIGGGKYRGKRLALPDTPGTRPTKSIIRGSVFDTLQFEIVDAIFVELFGGSGSMGLEALSRGAAKACFFEKDRSVAALLKRNCAALDAGATEVIVGDSFAHYPPFVRRLAEEGKRAFLYFDPPFEIREGMAGIYDRVIGMIAQTPPEAVEKIIVEHMSSVQMPESIGPFTRQKSKKFGKTSITYYTLA